VISPALPGRADWLVSDTDKVPQRADERLRTVLGQLKQMGAEAHGRVGADDPLLAFEDAIREFAPDHLLIGRGLKALDRAERLPGPLGPYGLQAAIAACHARARTAEETNWRRIAYLYETLARLSPSPVIELNRAVALTMAFGPEAGLRLIDQIADEPALRGYHLLPSARADTLARLDRHAEAAAEFERAAALTANLRERELLLKRAAESRGRG